MRVISKAALIEFWTTHPEAQEPLTAWLQIAKAADWKSPADVTETYSYAKQVDKLTVFKINGNKFRLAVVIHFNHGRLYVRKVMMHSEYDKGDWKNE